MESFPNQPFPGATVWSFSSVSTVAAQGPAYPNSSLKSGESVRTHHHATKLVFREDLMTAKALPAVLHEEAFV